MGSFAVGDVLLARFPFSDLTHTKLRPVVVVGLSEFENLIVAQITSKTPDIKHSLRISDEDIAGEDGLLHKDSYVRTSKIFTTDPSLIVKQLGELTPQTKRSLYKQLLGIFAPLNDKK